MDKKNRSGDVNPQYLNVYVTMSGANTYTEATINLPINAAASVMGGKTRVLEILKLFWFLSSDTLAEDAYVAAQIIYNTAAGMLAETDVAKFLSQAWLKMQLVTSGAISTILPLIQDFTDGQGNGILIGSSTLKIGANSVGQGAARTVACKILYRYKDVPIEEYVGLINGQN